MMEQADRLEMRQLFESLGLKSCYEQFETTLERMEAENSRLVARLDAMTSMASELKWKEENQKHGAKNKVQRRNPKVEPQM